MRILALDLGTKLGWADYTEGQPIRSGTRLLATVAELSAQTKAGLDRCCDVRPGRLYEFLNELWETGPAINQVWFEDVQFASTTIQAHLWGGWRGIIQMLPILWGSLIVERAVPVGTLKKFATGNGHAEKEDMARALQHLYPDRYEFFRTPRGRSAFLDKETHREIDDNEVDALHLLRYALANQTAVRQPTEIK